METFKAGDINHLYTLACDSIDNSTIYGGESTNDVHDYASFTQSMFEEMTSTDHYIGLEAASSILSKMVNCANNSDCSTFESSSCDATSPHCTGHGLFDRSNQSIREANLDVFGVSVDSLDLSSAESNNTHQMVLRCKEHDKSKYKIAFEESISSIKSDFRDDNRNDKAFNSITQPGLHLPVEMRSKSRKYYHQPANGDKYSNQMTKSEFSYTTWNQVKKRSAYEKNYKQNLNNRIKSHGDTYSKKCQSMPEMMPYSVYLKNNSFTPLGHYLPLYDLHNSNNISVSSNENSETISPPRSLIRHFIKNRRSPSTCSPASSSTSFDDKFNDSSDSSPYSPSLRSHKKSPSTVEATTASKIAAFPNPTFFQRVNHNWSKVNPSNSSENLSSNINHFEDSLTSDENAHLIPAAFVDQNTQANPIREEESELTDNTSSSTYDGKVFGREIATETDSFPWKCMQNGFSNVRLAQQALFMPARRSVSVDRFVTPTCPLYNGLMRRNTDTGSTNLSKLRFGREFGSLSSGYHSSRPCLNESHRDYTHDNLNRKYINNVLVVTSKSASTQIPVHIQDKQIQVSLSDDVDKASFTCRDYPSYESKINFQPFSRDAELSSKKPLYVCYPNYSLPDLKFLRNISTKNSANDLNEGTTVHLSPTKLDVPPPHDVAPTIIRRNTRKGVRPKSCTDYENMIANRSFNHIKDWDSLKVLLPNELRALIARLKGEHVACEDDKMKCENISENKANMQQEISSQKSDVLTRLQSLRRASSTEAVRRRNGRNCSCVRRNRYSLQEPLAQQIRRLSQPYNCDSNEITRSVTMPECIHHRCVHQCENIQYSRDNSCCTRQNCGLNNVLDMAPNEDKLCHIFSKNLSLKEFSAIINGHRADRLTSPSNIYAPIKEQAEESESFMHHHKNMEEDKLNQGEEKEANNCNNNMNETVILSQTSLKKMQSDDGQINAPKGSSSSFSKTINNKTPQKMKVTSCNSSGKRANLAKLRSASQPTTANNSPAKRPTSLATSGFKSMIPIAKGNKMSPTGNKIISPNNPNLSSFLKKI